VVTGPVGASSIRQMARISIGPRGLPRGPLPPRTATMPPTSPTPSLAALDRCQHFLQARQALRAPGRRRISRVHAATGCSIGSSTTPPHPAKAERLGLGTRRSGLADEQPRKRGSGVEELGRVDKVRRQRRSLRGGGLNPVTASHHRRQGQAPQADRRRGATAEERGVRLGLTLIAPPF
jgi:hypothetical protein